jgi:hypothetical protein
VHTQLSTALLLLLLLLLKLAHERASAGTCTELPLRFPPLLRCLPLLLPALLVQQLIQVQPLLLLQWQVGPPLRDLCIVKLGIHSAWLVLTRGHHLQRTHGAWCGVAVCIVWRVLQGEVRAAPNAPHASTHAAQTASCVRIKKPAHTSANGPTTLECPHAW